MKRKVTLQSRAGETATALWGKIHAAPAGLLRRKKIMPISHYNINFKNCKNIVNIECYIDISEP